MDAVKYPTASAPRDIASLLTRKKYELYSKY